VGTAADLLTATGITWTDTSLSSTTITSSLLDKYGIVILYGQGTLGPISASESTALETWVKDGGSFLKIGYHPTSAACNNVNGLPTSFGFSCVAYASGWTGAPTSIVAHSVTSGVATVKACGSEDWRHSGSGQGLISYTDSSGSTYDLLTVTSLGTGKVAAYSDDFAFYEAGSGSCDISYGDHKTMITNLWAWLAAH
jgi:hypothetical protein